jgi:hypothetical protein
MNQVRPTPAASENLRRHARHVVEAPGLLRLQETRGGIYVVTVLDVSKAGLRIVCPTAIPSGSPVEVKLHGARVFGTVRYAREVGYEFHLGIEADRVEAPVGISAGPELDLTLLFPVDITRLRRADV